MKKILFLALTSLSLLTLSCFGMPIGSLYTNITQAHLTNDGNGPTGSKKGEACASSILNIIATGDGGAKAAAANGGIKTISVVDHKTVMILGSLYTQSCSVVSGD